MANKILMPKLSPTMEEGQISRWLKAEGDEIEANETIAEVDTDKATMEMTSLESGTLLKILVPAGENAKLGQVIGIIGEKGEDISAILAEISNEPSAGAGAKAETNGQAIKPTRENEEKSEIPPVVTSEPKPATVTEGSKARDGRIIVSPIAARMALENSIDLKTVIGTGPNGRIIKRDIEALIAGAQKIEPATQASQIFGASAYHEENTSRMRQVIAERLTASTQNIPHFYLTVEIEMDNVLAFRKQINATIPEEQKVSVNDIIVKAAAMALVRHPWVNASFQDKTIRFYKDADISVAVAVEDGLITPVVRAANKKGILAISAEIKELAARAKAKKLQPEEYTGGTFSVSNLGMFGIQEFTAIINPPEAAIIAVGSASEKPVVRNGEIVIRSMMNVTMSCDHRVVDGATGAKFLQTFKQFMEYPAMMLL